MRFAAWSASERTLSIHAIFTTRRETFYWVTVLFTFALGTAVGDLIAERLAVGYWKSALLFAGAIAVVSFARLVLRGTRSSPPDGLRPDAVPGRVDRQLHVPRLTVAWTSARPSRA